jgi:glyceraldehyde 3-phosphate dehydrogenase (phosphorylating)
MSEKMNIAINGFGRIGRLLLRAMYEKRYNDMRITAINVRSDAATCAHLFKYDSIHGTFPGDIKVKDNSFDIGYGDITVTRESDPKDLPWEEMGIDFVFECTGKFKEKSDLARHIQAGAKKVLLSAPGTNIDKTIVYGVNHQSLTKDDTIVSSASCTTNCLAPLADVLHKSIGIERGFMTTIHSYTGDQQLIDKTHKDLRRARAAATSLIPSSTGAAKAVGLVLPELAGKLDGTAIRVPTPNVSLIDFTFNASRTTSVEEINAAMREATEGRLNGVLKVNDEPLVSIDFNHDPHSAIFDANETKVIDGTLCRVLAWYDNEWGFANRMIDTARTMSEL